MPATTELRVNQTMVEVQCAFHSTLVPFAERLAHKDDEVLVKVMSDSVCMSIYKLLVQGKVHKRCPQKVDTNPVIIGHELLVTS